MFYLVWLHIILDTTQSLWTLGHDTGSFENLSHLDEAKTPQENQSSVWKDCFIRYFLFPHNYFRGLFPWRNLINLHFFISTWIGRQVQFSAYVPVFTETTWKEKDYKSHLIRSPEIVSLISLEVCGEYQFITSPFQFIC